MCRLLDRDFQPPSYNDYDFSLPPQYQGTVCVLYATAIISKLFSTTPTTYVPEKDIVQMFDGLLLEAECKQENVKYINLTLTTIHN